MTLDEAKYPKDYWDTIYIRIDKEHQLLQDAIQYLRDLMKPKTPFDFNPNNEKEVQIWKAYSHFTWLCSLLNNYTHSEFFKLADYPNRFKDADVATIINAHMIGL